MNENFDRNARQLNNTRQRRDGGGTAQYRQASNQMQSPGSHPQTQTFNSVGSSVGRTDSRVGNGTVERRRKNSSAANRSSSVKTERGQSAAINKNHERNNGKKHGKKKSLLPKWLLLPDSGAEEDIIRIKGSFDRPMLIIVLALIGFGLIMVFSASYVYALSKT